MGFFDEPKKDTITNVKSGRRFDSGMSVEDILGHTNPGVPRSAPRPLQPATPGDSWLDRVFGEPGPIRPEAAFSTFGAGPPAGHPGRNMLSQALNQKQIIDSSENLTIPWELRQQLEEMRTQTEDQLKQIDQDVSNLNNQEKSIQDVFDTGSDMLSALGLPSTIQSVREDPEIKNVLDKVNAAISTGGSLDDAMASIKTLSDEELNDATRAFGREEWLSQMQIDIKNQVHNLVQNRKDLQDSLVEAEDWVQKEAEAQQMNLWDQQGDPSPSGRGFDVVVARVEPWMEANFKGFLTDAQGELVAGALNAIWQSIPSAEDSVDEEGNPVPFEALSPEQEQTLLALATVGTPTVAGLGLTQDKAIEFVDQVRNAIKIGQQASVKAASWKTSGKLTPGESGMATAIFETANEIYEDPETAQQMANSYYLHRLLQIRSDGDPAYRAGGNQIGLGGLPEHTYTDMGYKVSDVEEDTGLQMEALLTFIGRKYGPGYEGLQTALADFIHNPDTWGDL